MTKTKIQKIAEQLGWEVDWQKDIKGNSSVWFSKASPFGQDFSFEVYFVTYKEIPEKVEEYYDNYDASYEASLWLDSDGHGKNGAPYEMGDVYQDMKDCESMVYDLWEALRDEEE